MDVSHIPFRPILEIGLTELVGVDELLAQTNYSDEVAVTLGAGPNSNREVSGEFLQFMFTSSGGDELAVAGKLLIFDTTPTIALNDANLSAAEWATLIGWVQINSTDYVSDTGASTAFINDQLVSFHNVTSLAFAFLLESATSINSAAGDNELVSFNAWYRAESG